MNEWEGKGFLGRSRGNRFSIWQYQKYAEDMALKAEPRTREQILCTGLEHLEIDFEFPVESLELMGKWMPSLKTLKTILNLETIPIVCKVWQELTELVCLHGSTVDNSCIVRDQATAGFSEGVLLQMKICDLNDLERFQLDTYCGESQLTDDAVFKGFLKMTGLKYVQISVNSQMSLEAEEALRKGIQFCKVVRNTPVVDMDNGIDSGSSELESCGCDRCAFRRQTEEGVLETDSEGEDGLQMDSDSDDMEDSSSADDEDDIMAQLDDSDADEDSLE